MFGVSFGFRRFILCSLTSVLTLTAAFAQVPRTMSYQGVLTDTSGVVVPDGSYDIEFRLYDVSVDGAPIWSETHSGVQVSSGLIAVVLGSVTPLDLPFNLPYWLGVSVDGESELSPRIALASSPYALSVAIPLPANSVDAPAIADEAGIAQSSGPGNPVVGNESTFVRELTVTIDIPAPGYISLDASGMIGINNATGEQTVAYGIVETAHLTFPPDPGHIYYSGFGSVPNPGYIDLSFYCRRTYYKEAAGSYTFSLGSGRLGSFSSTARTFNPVLNAVYYPTSYGAVVTASSSASQASGPAGAASVPSVAAGPMDPSVSFIDIRPAEERGSAR